MNGDKFFPDLTLDPDLTGKLTNGTNLVPDGESAIQNPTLNDGDLSEDEQKAVEDFASKIDIRNSNMILKYGCLAQKKIADFSSSTLNNVRTKDLGAVGNDLSRMITELQGFDVGGKGILGFFKRKFNTVAVIKAKYSAAETNVEKICSILESHQALLLKDVAMLDKMYDLNKIYFKELSMYIAAGKIKLEKARTEELPALTEKAVKSDLPADAQEVRDFEGLCGRFEKKLYDLELTRMIALQMAPQIRLIQNNNIIMSEKIQSTLTNTIPLWKSRMLLALGAIHSARAAEAQRKVSEMTNNLLKKNAETIRTGTLEIIKEAERGIVDMETIKITNENLISTFDEVIRIQEEGREQRRNAEVELVKIESDLKTKLFELKKGKKP